MVHLPLSLDDGPILLKISESPCRHGDAAPLRTIALEGVRQKNAGAEKSENGCYRLGHRRCPRGPGDNKAARALHSQKDFVVRARIGAGVMIPGNSGGCEPGRFSDCCLQQNTAANPAQQSCVSG
jgi:hypothetical protein